MKPLAIASCILLSLSVNTSVFAEQKTDPAQGTGQPMTRIEAQNASFPDIQIKLNHMGDFVEHIVQAFTTAQNAKDLSDIKRSIGAPRTELGQIEAGLNDRLRAEKKSEDQDELDKILEALRVAAEFKVCITVVNNGVNEAMPFMVQDSWKLNDKWSFNMGVRYDDQGGEADMTTAFEDAGQQCKNTVDEVIKSATSNQ